MAQATILPSRRPPEKFGGSSDFSVWLKDLSCISLK